MGARLRSWWHLLAVITLLGMLVLVILIGYRLAWTGFSNKTLWDWLNLLGVLAIPATVGLGTIWFTKQQAKVSDAENKDNQREVTLQKYIDSMSQLLLHEKLPSSAEEDEVRKVARVQTLTALSRLDGKRKGSVVQFLYEAGLIGKGNHTISLYEADLSRTYLFRTYLAGADLSNANLNKANLYATNLEGANLSHANLTGVVLSTSSLNIDDLSNAMLSTTINLIQYPYSRGYLHGLVVGMAEVTRTSLREANLYGTFLLKADLREINFYQANMQHAVLAKANMHHAVLQEADLSSAILLDANLSKANLIGANLSQAELIGANLSQANLNGANLTGACLEGANLKHAAGISVKQLESQAKSLQGATMPDGSIHS